MRKISKANPHTFIHTNPLPRNPGSAPDMYGIIFHNEKGYRESRERPIQTIMKVSSKSLNYLPIFFSNSMVDRKVDSRFTFERFLSTSHVTIQGTCWKWKYLSRFYCEEILMKIRGNYQQNHFSNIQGSYQPTPNLTKFHCPFNTLRYTSVLCLPFNFIIIQ